MPTGPRSQRAEQVAAPAGPGGSANASLAHLVRNFVTGYAGLLSGVLLSLFLTPIVLRHLGAADYGLWILLTSVSGYVGLLDAGVSTAVVQTLARRLATGAQDEVAVLLATARRFFLVSSLLAVAVTGMVLPFVGALFHLGRAEDVARWCLLIGSATTAAGFMTSVPRATIYGSGRSYLATMVVTVIGALTQGVQIMAVELGGGVLVLFIVSGIGAAVNWVALLWVARTLEVDGGARRSATWSEMRALLRFGGRTALVQISGILVLSLDVLVIGTICPIRDVAPYDLGVSTSRFVRSVSTAATAQTLPTYAHFSALGARERQFELFSRGVSIAGCITATLVVTLIAFGRGILHVWLGHVPPQTYLVVLAANLVFMVQLPGNQAYVFLLGIGRTRLVSRVALLLAVGNVGLSILFTILLGPVGPLVGNAPQYLVVDFVVLPLVCCRLLQVPVARYAKEALAAPLAALLVSGAVAGLLWLVAGEVDSAWVLAEAAAVGVITSAVLVPVLVTRDPVLAEVAGRLRRRVLPMGELPR